MRSSTKQESRVYKYFLSIYIIYFFFLMHVCFFPYIVRFHSVKLYKSRTLAIEIETIVIAHGAKFLGQILVDVFQNVGTSVDVYMLNT